MFSVSSDLYNVIHQISRYLFPFLGLLVFLSALGWLFAERRSRRERLHNLPGTGTVGELVVLSGSRELKNMTWFPVPREGTLGSVRSCDLVVPCPGVKAQHLDFSWQDGLGLLIRPRSGCEAIVDGVPDRFRRCFRFLSLLNRIRSRIPFRPRRSPFRYPPAHCRKLLPNVPPPRIPRHRLPGPGLRTAGRRTGLNDPP